MLLKGQDEATREKMEVARWICFQIYSMNPYIKGMKARNARSWCRFPWEEMTPEEANAMKEKCHVTPEEQAELDRIFKEVFGDL